MASRNLNDLTPETRHKAGRVIEICAAHDVDILIYCTERSLHEQARLFRQGRSWKDIEKKMNDLRERGFDFLADIIIDVGPQTGNHVTNAAPGESWHNYREAFDAVPVVNGKAMWSYEGNEHLWDIYGKVVREVGMNWAGDWKSFKELPHAQLRRGGNPTREYSPKQILELLNENGLV